MASNDPTDTGGLFIGRRPGTRPIRYRDTPVRKGTTRQRADDWLAFGLLIVLILPSFGGCSGGEPVRGEDAPPIDPTKPVNFHEAMRFVYSGPSARQSGVTEAALDPAREAIIRGRVLNGSGQPIAGAKVVAPSHPS